MRSELGEAGPFHTNVHLCIWRSVPAVYNRLVSPMPNCSRRLYGVKMACLKLAVLVVLVATAVDGATRPRRFGGPTEHGSVHAVSNATECAKFETPESCDAVDE